MKLYIDTSSSEKIVVGIDGEHFTAKAKKDKSQKLLPLIEEKLKEKGKKLRDISEVEVNTGPGSFTGLRVGVSVAQAIAWDLDIPINGKRISEGQVIDIKYE